MPKILVVSTVNVLEDPRIFYKLVQSLKKEFNDVTYMVKTNKKEPFLKDSIKIIPLPIMKSIILRFILLHWIVLWKIIRGNFDIIQFNNPELIFVGFLLKNVFHKKVIFEVHENFSASFIDKKWIPKVIRILIRKVYPSLEKSLIKNFDGIIIAETSYRKIYGERAVELLNFPVFPKNEVKAKSFDEVKNFVYIGAIMEVRCIFELIETFKYILKEKRNAKLHLVGQFASLKLEKKVREMVDTDSLRNSIIIYGRKPLTEVYNILENSDFGFSLLKPIGNYIESLSTKIFDYMIWGIPFAVSDFEIYKEFVVNPNTGIVVNQDNPESVAKEVLKLISDKEQLKLMSANGRKSVLEKWNWGIEEKKYIKLIKRISNN